MIGKKLANRYEVLERIGGGGMAIVYRALDTILNRYVSVKVLRAQFVTDEDFIRRFRREAQAAASLSHPNVVNIYDVGVEDEIYYIVMEYINGKTLKEMIQERAPLPISEAVDIAKQICFALQHAHEHQIVHRDIKPHNILVGKDGHVKVTDFGIARAVTSNTITHNGSVLGSVHYFSPEQARGAITDVKSDIYSLGVVMYEMLTSELPFSGDSPISVALKHLQEHFVEPRQINPKIPQSVENVILKALAKDPEARYPNAKEMYRDLDKALQNPNVEKFITPDHTAYTQPTISIPAAAFQDQVTGHATAKWNTNVPPQPTSKKKPKKKNIWKTLGMVLGILLLSGVGIAAGFMIMTGALTGEEIQMPKVQGMKYEEAVDTLKQAGFKEKNIKKEEMKDAGGKDENNNFRQPMQAGYVFDQDPPSGRTVKTARTVTLKVSTGVESITMPNLEGKSEKEAKDMLSALNLDLSKIKFTEEPHKDIEKGKVTRQQPSPLVPIVPGQTEKDMQIYISSGLELVTVPDVKNMTFNQATSKLQAAGFTIGETFRENNDVVPKDSVIRQSQPPGTKAARGSTIELWVSNGPAGNTGELQKRAYTVEIKSPEPGKTTTITIKTTDALAKDKIVVNNEKLSASKKYEVIVYVSPTVKGEIEVIQDGVQVEKRIVEYKQ